MAAPDFPIVRTGADTLAPPPRAGRYRCIVMDPPWDQGKTGLRTARPNQGRDLDYPTMTSGEVKPSTPAGEIQQIREEERMASKEFETIRTAIKEKQQILGYHRGNQFAACPYEIGYSQEEETVLVSQFKGVEQASRQPTSESNVLPACMKVREITDLESKPGQWYQASFRGPGSGRPCVEKLET